MALEVQAGLTAMSALRPMTGETAGGGRVASTLFAGYGSRWNGNAGAYSGDHFVSAPQAYHINQRNEGIALGGVSGALMATPNMQMQTFVTRVPTAFACNQRDEVRDLGERAGAIQAQPGMKQQTFIATPPVDPDCLTPWDRQQDRIHNPNGVSRTLAGADGGGGRNPAGLVFAAGFCAGAAPSAGSIGFQEECVPTLEAAESGTNMIPSVLCLNDQGGQMMSLTADRVGTLRSQMHGHPPLVMATQQGGAEIGEGNPPAITAAAGMSGNNQPILFENHGVDSRYTGPHGVVPTMSARYGTGGNNVPLIAGEIDESFCIAGNIIDREVQNGGNGFGYQPNISYTLNTADRHAVFRRAKPYQETVGALCCGDEKGIGSQYVSQDKCIVERHMLIRRLTPLECERLQGFPDGWTDMGSDSVRYKALGNSVAIPCVEFVVRGIAFFMKE